MNHAGTFALLAASLLLITACDLINPPDWREGEEPTAECAERFDDWADMTGSSDAIWVPTYTYDITKLDLEAIQTLTVAGSDETAGSRERAASNETATARDAFMGQSVDEDGAFFLGTDPALYRVRGAAQPLDEIVATGCERQQTGMRLTDISATLMQNGSAVDKNESENRE